MRQIIATLKSELEAVEPELAAAQERLRLVSEKAELIKRLLATYEAEGEPEHAGDSARVASQQEEKTVIDSVEAFAPRLDHPVEVADNSEAPYRATFRGFKGLVATRN